MKTVGVIGGLGPETTAEFYLALVFSAYKINKTQRPPILIWNVPLRYKIEQDLLTKARGEERYIPYLVDAAKRLETAGADFLVMPCNSLHIFIEQIRRAVEIPVLSIVEETAKFLKSKRIHRVGILATTTTVQRKLYERPLAMHGIEVVLPDGFSQAKIGKMVNNLVRGTHQNADREHLLSIVESFSKRGVKHAILACTDLQLLIPEHPTLHMYDTMKLFADATVGHMTRTQ
ncbi:amino acid racemase [Candidatus Uhrbacteria bacterium]|nr:amino acid racemase [Candidatus Uhrbacteria bacterium]